MASTARAAPQWQQQKSAKVYIIKTRLQSLLGFYRQIGPETLENQLGVSQSFPGVSFVDGFADGLVNGIVHDSFGEIIFRLYGIFLYPLSTSIFFPLTLQS